MRTPKQVNRTLRVKGAKIQKIRRRVVRRLNKLPSVSTGQLADLEKRARHIQKRIRAGKNKIYYLRDEHEHLIEALADSFSRSLTRGNMPEVVVIETKDCAKERTFRLEPVCMFRIENPNATHALEFLAKDGGTWVYGRYNYDERAPGGVVANASNGFLVTEEDLWGIARLLKKHRGSTLSLGQLTMCK